MAKKLMIPKLGGKQASLGDSLASIAVIGRISSVFATLMPE